MPEVTFVGRESYLNQFRQLLTAPAGTPYILNLRGLGGIGKTKILQQIVQICNDEHVPNTGIIDFYDSELNSQINAVELAIARVLSTSQPLGFDPFAEYWQARQVAEHARRELDDHYGVLREKSKNQFIDDLEKWAKAIASKGKKGVLIFDTFEAVNDNQVGARLVNEWLPVLQTALVIISGRQQKDDVDFPSEIARLVEDAPVEAFTPDEATNYLKERGVWVDIEQYNVATELFELTGRQPLLLALSADRLIRYNFLTPIYPFELVKGAQQAAFEKKLVEDLANHIEYPESVIIGAMAHIPRPFDTQLINFLFPKNVDDPETILKELSQLSFVKEIKEDERPRYWFQDELRRLFHEHVFQADNFTWDEWCQDASKKMLAFYDEQISTAKKVDDKRAEEQAQADRFYHEIYLARHFDEDFKLLDNPKFAEAQQEFQKARETYEIRYANMILGALRSAENFLNLEQKFSLRLMEARSLKDNLYFGKSEQELEKLLRIHGQDSQKAVYIYNALGGTLEKLGELKKASTAYRTALKLSEDLQLTERLSLEELNIGQVEQNLGNFDEAIEHFKKAYEWAMKYNLTKYQDRFAKSLYELGYIYGLIGQYEAGLQYCDESIETWEKLDDSQQAAHGKVLRGAVHWMGSLYDKAISDLEQALDTLSPVKHQFRSEAYLHLGVAQWLKSDETGEKVFLNKARDSLEKSVAIAREYQNEYLPRALNQISNIYWWLGEKSQARQTNAEAFELAKKLNDVQYQIDSLLGWAEFDYDEGIYENIPQYADQLKQEYEGRYYFPLYYGRMRRILADIAFEQQRYAEAADYYAEGLAMVARHGGYGMYSIKRERENLEKKLQTIPPETSLNLCLSLKTNWLKRNLGRHGPQMISWIDRLIGRFAFQAHSG